jgi:hypothetical protein
MIGNGEFVLIGNFKDRDWWRRIGLNDNSGLVFIDAVQFHHAIDQTIARDDGGVLDIAQPDVDGIVVDRRLQPREALAALLLLDGVRRRIESGLGLAWQSTPSRSLGSLFGDAIQMFAGIQEQDGIF